VNHWPKIPAIVACTPWGKEKALDIKGIPTYNEYTKGPRGIRSPTVTKRETMQDALRPSRVRRGSVTGGLILIVLGFLWILNNLGYLPGSIWYNLWRFWPVVLILVGVDIGLRGFPTWFALPVLLLVVVVVIGAVLLVAPTLPEEEIVTESPSQQTCRLA